LCECVSTLYRGGRNDGVFLLFSIVGRQIVDMTTSIILIFSVDDTIKPVVAVYK